MVLIPERYRLFISCSGFCQLLFIGDPCTKHVDNSPRVSDRLCGRPTTSSPEKRGASRRRWESTTPHPTIQELESPMSHKVLAGLGTAAGGFVAAGLISLATGPVAHADGDDLTPAMDTDFMSGPLQDFGLFTDQSFADPDDGEFVATVFSSQQLGFTDILTSGADPSDGVGFGAAGIGEAGETVNTFIDPSDPALASMLSFELPFTDPLAQIFTDL